jgi:uncharacterized RDD family membrane protein YckC
MTATPGYPPPYALPPYPPPPGHPLHGAPPPGYPGSPWPPPRTPPTPSSPAGYPLADFAERLIAIIIDSVILGFASVVVIVPVLFVFIGSIQTLVPHTSIDPQTGEPSLSPGQITAALFGLFGILVAIVLIIRYVYTVELMFRSGQTIGKRVMNIVIVPLDPTRRLTRGMAAKRFLIEMVVGTIVPFMSYVDGLWQLWDQPYRQCLHDKFAQTVVIKR